MKKVFTLFAVVFTGIILSNAQNIAPQATASASTCNTGACATLNDLAYGTCGTQSMWITSSATNPGSAVYIQFTWPTTKVVNKITFFVGEQANRFLGGGTVQAWNGSAWVTVTTFTQSTGVCSYSVSFTAVATTQIRIIDIVVIGTQSSNVNFREIEIYGPAYNNDAGVTSMTSIVACTSPQKLDAVVTNFGKLKLDSFRLSWSVNNILVGTKYISSSITSGNSLTVNLDPSYAFAPSTSYNFKIWTSFPNGKSKDSGVVNDTLYNNTQYLGMPNLPTVADFKQCGVGKVSFVSTPDHPGDSILWYSAATGGNPVAVGKNASGPYITQTTTFYAQSAKIAKNNTVFGNSAGTIVSATQSNEYGTMFNITAINNFLLDSLIFKLNYTTPTNLGYQLYYKTGTYAGFQTNAAAWTKINQGVATFITIAGTSYGKVSAKSLFLNSGQGYSFYLTTDLTLGAGNSFLNTSAAPTVSNVDLSILTNGSIILGKFGATSVTANYLPDLQFIYKKECFSGTRLPVIVTVKPRPTGANVIPVATFQGQFKGGIPSDPDVLQANKTNTYELIPPTGYTNAGHGVTWYVSSISARTKYNVLVPSTEYTVTQPTASAAGQLIFKPKVKYEDSLITFSINYADLGPNYCDSTLKRTIYIAPTPYANIKMPATACSNNEVLIENFSTISKGSLSYMWYFGDGDSSDVNTPTHIYKSKGVYSLRLKATSDGWKVVDDTIMTILVEELPNMKFNIVNRCLGSALTFNNSTTIAGTGTLTFVWSYGDGNFFTTTSSSPINKGYASAGAYKVKLIADNKGCRDSLVKNAYQFVRPKADYVQNYGSCLNEPFRFTNTSTLLSAEFGNVWDFGDLNGEISTDVSTVYTFATAGTKNVKLKVISEFNCIDSITKQVVVKQSPTTDFSFPFSCERTPTPFTNLTNLHGESLVLYTWNFDQGSTSNITNPVVSWTSLGTKNVSLNTVLANGCSEKITKKLEVGVQPLVDFEFENQCVGNEAIFTNLTTHRFGEIKYDWSFGDGFTSKVPSPTHNYAGAQSFFVQLKASVTNGCADSAIKSINISQKPATCDFDYSRNWVVGQKNFNFTPKGGAMTGLKYIWLMGDGNKLTSNAAGISYTFNSSMLYCVTMKASNQADCDCSMTKCIDVATGVEDIQTGGFNIFPNPTSGIFNITSANGFNNVRVEIVNILGESVKGYTFDGVSTGLVDLTNYASGIYTVRIVADGQVIVKRIIVQ